MSATWTGIRCTTSVRHRSCESRGEDGDAIKGWKLPSKEELNKIWDTVDAAPVLETEQATYIEGVVHHAEQAKPPLRTRSARNSKSSNTGTRSAKLWSSTSGR
jgi:hypothetical protein